MRSQPKKIITFVNVLHNNKLRKLADQLFMVKFTFLGNSTTYSYILHN